MTIALKEMFEQIADTFEGEEGCEKAYKSLLALTEKGGDYYMWLHLLEKTFKEDAIEGILKMEKKRTYNSPTSGGLFDEYYALCNEYPEFKQAAESLLHMAISDSLSNRLILMENLVKEFKNGREAKDIC